jgi:S1-C subfamily serine protease
MSMSASQLSDAITGLALRKGLSRPEHVAECMAAQAASSEDSGLSEVLQKSGYLSRVQLQMLASQSSAGPQVASGFVTDSDLIRKALKDGALKPADLASALQAYASGPEEKRLSELILELGLMEFTALQRLSQPPKAAEPILAQPPQPAKAPPRAPTPVPPPPPPKAVPAAPAPPAAAPKRISKRSLPPGKPAKKINLALVIGGGAGALVILILILVAVGGSSAPECWIAKIEPASIGLDGEVHFSAGVRGGSPPYRFYWSLEDSESGYRFLHESREASSTFRVRQVGNYRIVLWVLDRGSTRSAAIASDVTLAVASPMKVTAKLKSPAGLNPMSAEVTGEAEGGRPPYKFEWKSEAGAAAQGQTARLKLSGVGKHKITLTVEDAAGQRLTQQCEAAVEDPSTAVVSLKLPMDGSTGTGFLVEYKGEKYVITNDHVASGFGPIFAVPFEAQADRLTERRIPAKVVAVHPDMDLVALKLEWVPDRTPLGFAEGLPQMNEKIRIIGYSGGFSVLSRDGSAGQYDAQSKLFNVAASVNPGDSGGPVLKADSPDVIGVMVQRYERSGGGRIMQGHASAIPVSFVRDLLETLSPDRDRSRTSISRQVESELAGIRERTRAYVIQLRDLEKEMAKIPQDKDEERFKLFERFNKLMEESRQGMEDFARNSRRILAREGIATSWGAALWQARSLAESICHYEGGLESGQLLATLYKISEAATQPSGRCGVCQGKGELVCRTCEGKGTCPLCRSKSNPECPLCAGTTRCLACMQALKFPCVLCSGKGNWP